MFSRIRITILSVIALAFISTSLSLTTAKATSPQQSAVDRAEAYHQALQTPAGQTWLNETTKRLAEAYPRLARNVRRGNIDLATFLVLRRRSDQFQATLANYEAEKISTQKLNEQVRTLLKVESGQVHIMSCSSDCAFSGNVYYYGCRDGGGDLFTCYVATEGFLCMCRNGCVNDPGYFYIDCWPCYPGPPC